jgi:hypothetical protein
MIPDKFWDKHGLITEANGNGGDSANRMGLWYWLKYMDQNNHPGDGMVFGMALEKLEPHPFVFVRHPDHAPDAGRPGIRDFAWWNDWNVFSRDQWLPLVTAIGLTDHDKFSRIFNTTLKRHGTLSNGDILGPGHWVHLSRILSINARPSLWKRLGHLAGDLYSTFGYIIGCIKRDPSDSLVGFMMLLTAATIHPTWISKLNLQIVKFFGDYPKMWKEYFGHDNAPPFHELAQPLFKRYL